MRYRLFIFSALLSLTLYSSPLSAQSKQEPVDTVFINKLKDEGINRSQVMEISSWLMDVYGPRLSGSPQLKRANEWTKSQFEKWGLENAHLESWEFGKGWELQHYALTAHTPYTDFPVISYPKAWSKGYTGKGDVVYLDVKNEDDFAKYKGKLRGKFVMVAEPKVVKASFDPIAKRQTEKDLLGLANAAVAPPTKDAPQSAEAIRQATLAYLRSKFLFDEGVAAILDETYRGTAGSVAISGASVPASPDVPYYDRPRAYAMKTPEIVTQISLNQEHYGRLYRLLKKGIKVEMDLEMKVKFQTSDANCYNTVAEIAGTDLKEEVVMLGAHLDSWHTGTGATDNGAGSVAMMEAVRLLKAAGIKPRRTIRIALWSGEEQGLLGSRAYVKQHFGNAPRYGMPASDTIRVLPEHAKLSGYFNLDNGTGQIRGIYLQQNDACRNLFRTWLEPFKDWNATTVSFANTGGTDHLSFDAVGLPGFQFIQDAVEYGTWTHHSNMDVYERIQEEDMKRNAVMIASFVYLTAQRDEKLPRKSMDGKVFKVATK